jgi:hypothetical protein
MNRVSKKRTISLLFLAGCALLFMLLIEPAWAMTKAKVSFEGGNLTVDAQKSPLFPLLESIAQAAGIHILVSKDLKPCDVTIRIEGQPIEGALKRILSSYSYVMIYENEGGAVRLSAVKVYPQGENPGTFVALGGQDRGSDKGEAGPVMGDLRPKPESAVSSRTVTLASKGPGASGLLVPNQYGRGAGEGLVAVTGKRLEAQERKAYDEITALKREIAETQGQEKQAALNIVLMEKLEKFEALQRANRNKIEALHRIELFNQNKEKETR